MEQNNIKPADLFPLKITEEALKQFASAKDKNEFPVYAIRIAVKGGGCSGFMHNLEFISEADVDAEEDSLYSVSGLLFAIDCFSEPYLKDTTIDYLHSLRESGFKFLSDTKRTCGCGSSFS